jgi:hypothetical protein
MELGRPAERACGGHEGVELRSATAGERRVDSDDRKVRFPCRRHVADVSCTPRG